MSVVIDAWSATVTFNSGSVQKFRTTLQPKSTSTSIEINNDNGSTEIIMLSCVERVKIKPIVIAEPSYRITEDKDFADVFCEIFRDIFNPGIVVQKENK